MRFLRKFSANDLPDDYLRTYGMQRYTVSIIIPTLNEADGIGPLVKYLFKHGGTSLREIIVVDANSQDQTAKIAAQAGADVLKARRKRRSTQLNQGAEKATGDILYFVHADTYPPDSFVEDIQEAVAEGYGSGCYRSKLGSTPRLKFQSWLSQFPLLIFRGGDQTLYVKKDVFQDINGFSESYVIMEDFEIIPRLRRSNGFKIMEKCASISDRKYQENSFGRVNLANIIVVFMYFLGFPQVRLLRTYRKMIRGTKY